MYEDRYGLTRQVAVEGLLPSVASHVRFQSITASMGEAFAVAAPPFARVLFLSVFDVRVVYVFDQLVHVALVASRATVPVAHGDLVLEIIVI